MFIKFIHLQGFSSWHVRADLRHLRDPQTKSWSGLSLHFKCHAKNDWLHTYHWHSPASQGVAVRWSRPDLESCLSPWTSCWSGGLLDRHPEEHHSRTINTILYLPRTKPGNGTFPCANELPTTPYQERILSYCLSEGGSSKTPISPMHVLKENGPSKLQSLTWPYLLPSKASCCRVIDLHQPVPTGLLPLLPSASKAHPRLRQNLRSAAAFGQPRPDLAGAGCPSAPIEHMCT